MNTHSNDNNFRKSVKEHPLQLFFYLWAKHAEVQMGTFFKKTLKY